MNIALDGKNLSFNLLNNSENLVFSLSSGKDIIFNLSTPTFLYTDIYNGITDVTPDFDSLVLKTSHKIVTKNIVVNPIQVEKVSNLSGGITVFIGGII